MQPLRCQRSPHRRLQLQLLRHRLRLRCRRFNRTFIQARGLRSTKKTHCTHSDLKAFESSTQRLRSTTKMMRENTTRLAGSQTATWCCQCLKVHLELPTAAKYHRFRGIRYQAETICLGRAMPHAKLTCQAFNRCSCEKEEGRLLLPPLKRRIRWTSWMLAHLHPTRLP